MIHILYFDLDFLMLCIGIFLQLLLEEYHPLAQPEPSSDQSNHGHEQDFREQDADICEDEIRREVNEDENEGEESDSQETENNLMQRNDDNSQADTASPTLKNTTSPSHTVTSSLVPAASNQVRSKVALISAPRSPPPGSRWIIVVVAQTIWPISSE